MASPAPQDQTTTCVDLSCPFCGRPGKHLFDAFDRNRETTSERFPYSRCQSCGTVFLPHLPSELGRYYTTDYYRFDADGQPRWKTEAPVLESCRYRVAMIRRHAAAGHLVEIGAGTGAFASAALEAGFDVTAIEMDQRCCDYLSAQGINSICSDDPVLTLESLPAAEVITMWHVLEHLPDPARVLEAIASKLTGCAVLAIAIPNLRSLQFRLLKSRWAHLDAPRHVCLTPPDALIARASRLGLRCVERTTNDPDGLECNRFGWITAFQSRPAAGQARPGSGLALRATTAVLTPFEQRAGRGSAVTMLLRGDR